MTTIRSERGFFMFALFFFAVQGIFAQQQIHVDHAPQNGVFIQNPVGTGILIDSAAVGAQILRTDGVGLQVALTGSHGIEVYRPEGFGLLVDSASNHGIQIARSIGNALHIVQADSNGIDISQIKENAIRINGAQRGIDISGVNEGVRIQGSGGNGVSIESPFSHGIQVIASGQSGASIRNTEAQGVDVQNTGSHGLRIREAGINGIDIDQSVGDGIKVTNSGGQGLSIAKTGAEGIRVASSEGSGVKVFQPIMYGLHVIKPGVHGVVIDTAAADGLTITAAGDDGINIVDPGDDGITVVNAGNDGIHVNGAAESAGIFINSASSNDPSVHVAHADDSEIDLHFGGDAQIESEANYEIRLDAADDIDNATFMLRNSAGQVPLIVTEGGDLGITGHLSKGSGSFKIDHPLDPQNQYLYHSFVESPDMMNIYNGNVLLDENGRAKIEMPDWFEPLNRDFRYQLTPIGGGANLYVSDEINDGAFWIAGGTKGLKVSWMVTGIRQDRFANANRLVVEVEKEADRKGTYLHPEVWEHQRSEQVRQDLDLERN